VASSLKKVELIGRLGKDPEVKNLQNGSAVANFSVATSEVWKDKRSGEKQEKTEWHKHRRMEREDDRVHREVPGQG